MAERRARAPSSFTVGLTGALAFAVALDAYAREFDPGITIPNGGWNAPLGDLVTYLAFIAR
jgi:hypothetical protein